MIFMIGLAISILFCVISDKNEATYFFTSNFLAIYKQL